MNPLPSFLPAHHVPGGGFRNVPGSPVGWATRGDFWRFLRSRLANRDEDVVIPAGHVLSPAEAAAGWEAVPGDKLQWLGHSAFRWQLGSTVLLSDPLLTARASPFAWMGPKRFVASPLRPEEAGCEVVLLTHNHYDHLDLRTLRRLPSQERAKVIVPLGVGPLVRKAARPSLFELRRVSAPLEVAELDWHESVTVGDGISVTLVPAVHFSARTPFDRNKTLWGGYVIQRGDVKVHLSGDTGYHPTVFREIGERYGPFHYGLVPIGAYEPRAIMAEHHATPEEGVAIGKDAGARTLIGHHWGALRLTTEDPFEPPGRFNAAAREAGYQAGAAKVMTVGGTLAL